MISLRQLLVVAIVAAGIWLIKRLHSRFTEYSAENRGHSPAPSGFQDMVLCQRCGTYVPRLQANGSEARGYVCNDATCTGAGAGGNYSSSDKNL
jgi:hypothetical protein